MGLTKDDKIDVPTTKFKKDGKKVGIEVTNQKYVQVVSNCKEEKLNHWQLWYDWLMLITT